MSIAIQFSFALEWPPSQFGRFGLASWFFVDVFAGKPTDRETN